MRLPNLRKQSFDNNFGSSEQMEIFSIAVKMKNVGLADSFIVNAVETALKLDGVADLMHLWSDESDIKERNEIIVDIQDMIDAYLEGINLRT